MESKLGEKGSPWNHKSKIRRARSLCTTLPGSRRGEDLLAPNSGKGKELAPPTLKNERNCHPLTLGEERDCYTLISSHRARSTARVAQ